MEAIMKPANQLLGCCGLDCEACDARIATITNDNALRKKPQLCGQRLTELPSRRK